MSEVMDQVPITEAPAAQKRTRKLTKAQLAKLIEGKLTEAAPDLLDALTTAMIEGAKAREKPAMELIARLLLGDKGPGGVNIVSQTLNVNNNAPQKDQRARGFESIVRRLETKDTMRLALPEPTPIRERLDPDGIIDAEVVS